MPSTNLPVAVDPFVGRDDVVSRLQRAVDEGMLYVVGPPGSGKTRTTIEAVRRAMESGAVGEAWYVDLVPVKSVDGIVRALGDATRLATPPSEQADGALAHYGRVLSSRNRAVVILDNAEHCSVDTRHAAEQLAAAGVRVVITSRRRPDDDVPTFSLGALNADDARALFFERMRRYRPTHQPTDEERELVGRLTQRLDGLPLAIELAAARTQVLDLDVLLQRLDEQSGSLATSSALERSFASSWDLLDEDERTILRRCTVFHGSFEATAAEAIFDDGETDVLDTLQRLRSHSLLAASEHGGRLRLRLLQSLADFVGPRAEALPPQYEPQFRRYYAKLAERWLPRLHRDDAVRARELLQLDFDNLLAAYRLCVRDGDLQHAGALFETLRELMLAGGAYRALADLGEEYLAAHRDEAVTATAIVHLGKTTAEGMLGLREAATADVEAAREIAETVGDPTLLCRADYRTGWLQWVAGDVDAGLLWMRRALERARDEHLDEWHARALYAEATQMESRRKAPVHVLVDRFESAVRAAQRVENLSYEALSWSGLTATWLNRGFPERASESARHAVELFETLGDGVRLAKARLDASEMELERGDVDAAGDDARAAIEGARRLGISWVEFLATITLTKVAIDTGSRARFEEAKSDLDALQPQVAQPTFVADADLARAIGEWTFGDPSRAYGDVMHATELLEAVFESVVELLTRSLRVALSLIVTGEFDTDELEELREAADSLEKSDWLRHFIDAVDQFARLDGAAPESVEAWYRFVLGATVGEATVASRSFWVRHLLNGLGEEAPEFVTEAVAYAVEHPLEEPLLFARGRQWLRPPGGEWSDLSNRPQLVELLELLTERGDQGAKKDAIRDHLWPGEKLHPKSAKNRLHAAISMLRKAGAPVEYHSGKYRIDPATPVVVLEST